MQRDQKDDRADPSLADFVAQVETCIRAWIETEWQAKQQIAAAAASDARPEAIASLDLRRATLSVETLASRIDGMSEAALRRKLQQAGATHSPGEMIHRARMNYAERLLRERRYTIAAVATMSGFDDQRYFAARFREHFGISPRDYRSSAKRTKRLQEKST